MACLRLRNSLNRDSVVLNFMERVLFRKTFTGESEAEKKRRKRQGKVWFDVKSRLGLMPGGGFGPLPALKS